MDATLIAAPTSTKNEGKARDPERHQSKKCNEWYSGMKAHIGVDTRALRKPMALTSKCAPSTLTLIKTKVGVNHSH